ncbi:hypothetical protein QKU48_gp1311 [Fadolivirus algeromassiliense]|jgi:hypothetical protein|uniref:Uncharacterized protein n=1 Tax=Fadolivirus FV1/VV64 TaxID=3070911 RepID=A0A7D3UWF9_9VIRU|nr:hypothetical protein QKU48_gp1311 [Fadolivirus algeromassiliense]QKF94769.1 hypothetical protein Fadolivirus_1_1311 [Fadolivirus FV1/VV64]
MINAISSTSKYKNTLPAKSITSGLTNQWSFGAIGTTGPSGPSDPSGTSDQSNQWSFGQFKFNTTIGSDNQTISTGTTTSNGSTITFGNWLGNTETNKFSSFNFSNNAYSQSIKIGCAEISVVENDVEIKLNDKTVKVFELLDRVEKLEKIIENAEVKLRITI